MTKRRKRLLGAAFLGLLLGAAGYFAAGSYLLGPARAVVGPPPDGVGGTSVGFESRSGARLAAWDVPGPCGCGVVVVLHGVRANRLEVADRVRLFHEAGYAVVAVDQQAHGESTGDHITFGHRERLDAQAAVAYARTQYPLQPVAVVGISLGGAAAALAGPDLGADAVVLEAVYADLASATRNRLRIRGGGAAASLTPVLLLQLPLRTGIHVSDLRPVDRIGSLGVPVLVVAGTEDRHTTPADTRRLFAAAAEPKALWWVEGAAHVDFLRADSAGYRTHVLGFLRRSLGAAGRP